MRYRLRGLLCPLSFPMLSIHQIVSSKLDPWYAFYSEVSKHRVKSHAHTACSASQPSYPLSLYRQSCYHNAISAYAMYAQWSL